jgi:hypothetical protein
MSTPRTTKYSQRLRWRLWLQVVLVTLILYVVGYFALMDRHRPASPYPRANDYFESSFRWAAKQHASKDNTGPETTFPEVTFWNVFYNPLDKVFFNVFPRPTAERQRLREIGYYQ